MSNEKESENFFKNVTKPRFLRLINFLNKNKIKYFASGGTLLGAIRHCGIIPWDNDNDIGVHIDDAEEIINVINSEGNFFLWSQETKFQIKENKINSISDFKKLKYQDGLYVTSLQDNRTVCDLEFWNIYDKNIGGGAWEEEYSSSKFFCPNSGFNMGKNGAFNIPVELAFPLKKNIFYKNYINVFKDSEKYLKIKYGENCLTHGPDENKFFSNPNLKIKTFDPL